MTKSDLKTGYIVTLRNGNDYVVILDSVSDLYKCDIIVNSKLNVWDVLSVYNEDLTNKEFKALDIIKVEIPYHPLAFQNVSYKNEKRKLLWERKEMSSKSNKEIMQKAINTYGLENQMIKTIEELAELSQNLSKALIRLNSKSNTTLSADLKSVNNIFKEMTDADIMLEIFERITDVDIMLEQCKRIFECEDWVQEMKNKKLQDLQNVLKMDKEE